MVQRRALLTVWVIVTFGFHAPVFSLERENLPPWVALQVGEDELRDRNFAIALEYFSDALARQPLFPEALLGIAQVHEAAGDFSLARQYYVAALAQADALVVRDDITRLQLRLVDLLSLSDDPVDDALKMEQLHEIVRRDDIFSRRDNRPHQRDQMRRVLYEGGLNRVIVLYRLNEPQSTSGHRRLGNILRNSLAEEDRDAAVDHLLFAVVEVVGRAVTAMLEETFDYQFDTVENLLMQSREVPAVHRYLLDMELPQMLRELQSALEVAPHERSSTVASEIARIQFNR
jgi:tetratricopeptide (TPR) repeat protein